MIQGDSKSKIWIHILATVIFIYILLQFLSMTNDNVIYKFYTQYLMNRYYLLLYLILCVVLYQYDKYIAVLMALLIIPPFKIAHKEFFEVSIPTRTGDNGVVIADIPRPTMTNLEYVINADREELLKKQALGIDERFKTDPVVIKDILRQIKSQVDFDPYKTNLDKSVIYELYNRYFDNDIFIKLKKNNNDSEEYLAAGNFNYVPTVPQTDYDITTYQNLSDNVQFGISPLVDGIQKRQSRT